MIFELLDVKPRNPFLALALDEALCLHMKRSDYAGGIRLWSNPYSIIFGRTCVPAENLADSFPTPARASHKKSVWSASPAVCRRPSGGGTVLHGPGNLNYSIFVSLNRFPELFSLRHSYEMLLNLVARSLAAQGFRSEMRGQSDLVLHDERGTYKISGNAQFRKHGVIVLHGTLITRPDLVDMIELYLKHPPKEPEYRAGRAHGAFVGALPDSFDLSSFYRCIARELKAFLGAEQVAPLPEGHRRRVYSIARRLVYDYYASEAWVLSGQQDRARTRRTERAAAEAAERR